MILRVENLSMQYQQAESSISVLAGLNLEIERGESVAILGQSGAGKSTLLSLLAGLDQPTSGSVKILEQDIVELQEEPLAKFRSKNIGIIFQQFHLLSHLSAVENVALPLEIAKDPQATEKARQAIEEVGLGHRHGHFPSQLSGGECQRVAIARAFVVRPAVLLADEPSGNLDRQTGDQVMDLLFEMTRSSQMTMILVTHKHIASPTLPTDLSIARWSSQSGNKRDGR